MRSSTIGNTNRGVPRHEPAPAGDERLLARRLRVVDRGQERNLQPVDLVAEEPQHRDEQRVREQHRGQHAERAPDPELGDEVEPEEGEPTHADRDRQAGEQHGPAGGGTRLRCGVTGDSPSWRSCLKRVTMNSE